MVDDMTPQDPLGSPVDPAAPEADTEGIPPKGEEGKRGFFSTATGRIVGIVAALLIVGGIVAAIAVFLFVFMFGGAVEDAAQEALIVETTTATASVEDTGAMAVVPDEIPYSDIYTFRDIFEPLVRPPVPVASSTVDATEGKLTADVSEGTLLLQGIVVENGVPVAVLVYDGTEYRLIEGDAIPGTPWQVLTIGESSVTMLYGDTQVTLTVGQGVTR